MKSHLLGTSTAGPISIDVERLISTRMLLCANSGGGKSWALRRLLEQTHGAIQQLVIDPEGEFFTLRERFDYVLAGKGGDCPAEPRSAALLARRLLELGTSSILDLYELAPSDRILFVRRFVEALVDAPRELWHPVLVVIDEAHTFAPEKGHGEAQSAEAVARLMSQGRKRGFAGVLATQRLSKLAKDVAAEANNVLIGRAVLDVDQKRAAAALGMSSGDAASKLRSLKSGHFYAFGPALSGDVVEVHVGDVATSHPKAGQRTAPPPPPRERVRKILGQLADLPKEAEAELRTITEAKQRVAQLERELAAARRAQPEALVERVEVPVLTERELERLDTLRQLVEITPKNLEHALRETAKAVVDSFSDLAAALRARTPAAPNQARRSPPPATNGAALARQQPAPRVRSGGGSGAAGAPLPRGERAVLTAIAQHHDGVTREQLTVLTGYKRSTRDAYLQRMGVAGLTEQGGDRILATQAGLDALGSDFEPLPTGDALREHWLGRLPEGERRILELVAEVYPEPLDREAISKATEYARSSRDAYLQRLAARRLVSSTREGVRARAELFGGR
ncbi:MAG: DUF87 domain-containing protein [Planctomycetota bacterium]